MSQDDTLEERLKKQIRRATNAEYMLEAYYNMLGPKGREVADNWRKEGTRRVHYSWGPKAREMTGEQRAEYILYLNEALARSIPIESIDSDLETMAIDEVIREATK